MSYVAQSTSSSVSSGRAHVTSCGSARCLRFRLSSCPHCVRRSSTTHGCSASTHVESLHDLEEYMGEQGRDWWCAFGRRFDESFASFFVSLVFIADTGPSGSGSSWTEPARMSCCDRKGRRPKNRPFSLCWSRLKTDILVPQEGGGDPKTDHSLFVGMARASAILVGFSPHGGAGNPNCHSFSCLH